MKRLGSLRTIGIGREGEEGQALIFVAVLMVAVLGFAGLVLDYGRAAAEHRQAQNAADSAAQGAAYQIYAGQSEGAATTTADGLMPQYGYTSSNLTTIQFLDSSGAPTSDASSVQYVHTVVTKTINTFLLGIVGVQTATVAALATVKVGPGAAPCVLCLLSTSQGLTASGSETFSVTGGNIWINAAGTSAVSSGSETITASVIGMNGGYTYSGSDPFSPAPETNAGTVPDPLASVPAPSVTTPSYGTVVETSSATLNPGIYSGLILSGSGTLTFNPGIYVFAGSLVVSGNWNFSGNGVMLYLTCSGYSSTNTQPCNGSSGASLNWSGNTTYNLTAPISGPYKGMAIFYDRTNTAGITLSGSPSDNLTGTIYAKQAAATLSGSPGVSQLNSLIVVGSATVSGSGTFNIVYNQDQNYGSSQLPVFTR